MLISRIRMATSQEQPQKATKQSQKRPHQLENTTEPRRTIDLTNDEDLKTLKETCDELWRQLYEVGCRARNHPFYHSCCNSFSKRSFGEAKHFHPKEYTSPFIDWIAKHEISDAKGLYNHFLKQVKLKPTYPWTLPGLNLYHGVDSPVEKMLTELQQRVSLLEKRNAEVEAELDELTKTKQKVLELEEKLQKETEQREFAEFVNEVNRQLEKQQSTKVQFDYDLTPVKAVKRW